MYSMATLLIIVCILIALHSCSSTPLDDYVNAPDPVFRWQRLQTYQRGTHTLYVLNMTSQRWLDETFSSRPIWWHYMTIVVPKTIRRSRVALLLIEGGTNNDKPPTTNQAAQLALSAGSIVIGVKQIPNQPMSLAIDPSNTEHNENGLNGWTWNAFMNSNGNTPEMLLRIPMTKAVVRAMDATQQFLQQEGIVVPQSFVLAGISKRGGIAWTTPVVDKRVIGTVPIVMGLLNIRKNLMSHYRSLGGWSFALRSQYELNLTRSLTDPNFDKLAAIDDPYSYFDRYANTQIFQIEAAGDPYFLVDSEDFFWDDLKQAAGGSYLRRIPNVGHSITGHEPSLLSFFLSISDKQPMPSMTWARTLNGTHGQIRAIINHGAGQPKPNVAAGYRARTSDTARRDFRQSKINQATGNVISNNVVWTNTAVNLQTQNSVTTVYTLTLPIPTNGYWDAAYIEVTFSGPDDSTLALTTETLIVPNTYPFEECAGQECYGTLV